MSKHHPALENPSNIRGSAGGEGGGGRAGTGGTVGVGSGALSRVPVSFSKTRRAIRESRALVRGIAHIFSPHALYVVTYPELSAQGRLHRMTAVTHASPATDLAEVSIGSSREGVSLPHFSGPQNFPCRTRDMSGCILGGLNLSPTTKGASSGLNIRPNKARCPVMGT